MQQPFFASSNENLSSNYNLLLFALQASTCGIILTDNRQPDNPIIFVNKAFEELSGYESSEILGRNCRFMQGKNRDQLARYLLADAVKKEQSCVVELRNYRKNGTEFWNELYMSPVKNEAGIVTHFIGVQNDITTRKTAEFALFAEREGSPGQKCGSTNKANR